VDQQAAFDLANPWIAASSVVVDLGDTPAYV
jgi:hypothetical protein